MAELERDEGLRLFPYKDSVGKTTIGIGRNLDDVGISEAEARAMLASDIARVEADLDKALPWWRKLDEDRQRVLANMCFNLGLAKLMTFRNTLGAIFLGDFTDAAASMLASKWAQQVGPRAARLAARMRGDGSIT
jgi:lysozyme